jgi:hypothetical protein
MAATTFGELWTELQTDAKAELTKFESVLVNLEHNVVPIIESDFIALVNATKQVAINAVIQLMQVAPAVMSGQEKLSVVATKIFQNAESQEIAVTMSAATAAAQHVFNAVATQVSAK